MFLGAGSRAWGLPFRFFGAGTRGLGVSGCGLATTL